MSILNLQNYLSLSIL